MGMYRPCTARLKPGTYSGKVRVHSRVPSIGAREISSLGATCVNDPALLTVPVQVHVIVRVRVGICAMRAHEHFVQCASAVSSCPCSTARGREHVIIRLRALFSCVEACTVEFMYESQYLSTVLVPQGFVPLCTSVQCEPRGLYTVCWCLPPRLCTSVYFSTARAQTGLLRYESARALYNVLVLTHQSFVPSAYVLVWTCTVRARKGLCFRVRYEPQVFCAVRAYKGFIYIVCWC